MAFEGGITTRTGLYFGSSNSRFKRWVVDSNHTLLNGWNVNGWKESEAICSSCTCFSFQLEMSNEYEIIGWTIAILAKEWKCLRGWEEGGDMIERKDTPIEFLNSNSCDHIDRWDEKWEKRGVRNKDSQRWNRKQFRSSLFFLFHYNNAKRIFCQDFFFVSQQINYCQISQGSSSLMCGCKMTCTSIC